jgi:hypothetical protein
VCQPLKKSAGVGSSHPLPRFELKQLRLVACFLVGVLSLSASLSLRGVKGEWDTQNEPEATLFSESAWSVDFQSSSGFKPTRNLAENFLLGESRQGRSAEVAAPATGHKFLGRKQVTPGCCVFTSFHRLSGVWASLVGPRALLGRVHWRFNCNSSSCGWNFDSLVTPFIVLLRD